MSEPQRRAARRRPAGTPRGNVAAANDDSPSIGGLIFALQQKPSSQPFLFAAIASGVWLALSVALGGALISGVLQRSPTLSDFFLSPAALTVAATIIVPIAIFWFLAMLIWRAQELRLMSSAMTEVAVRLAEPDRMAEKSIASLGQSVRRQVAFMNEAVSRALGRASELEALVHNEVAELERSYDENELRIRHLIEDLASERDALRNSSERVGEALRGVGSDVTREIMAVSEQATDRLQQVAVQLEHALRQMTDRTAELTSESGNAFLNTLSTIYTRLGSEVPQLIDKLGAEQTKLTVLIDGASTNLAALESALRVRTETLETTLSERTSSLELALGQNATRIETLLTDQTEAIDSTLANRQQLLDATLTAHQDGLNSSLAMHGQQIDAQLLERTKQIDSAFTERLRTFDEALLRSTMAMDNAVSERARSITNAMETHAKALGESMEKQAGELDETLMRGISAVRRTSENITRQSVKTIEGLAGQAELLRNVSENLLGQINSITNRFENQGQVIMKAANSLEAANFKIDSTLQTRHQELGALLDRISDRTQQFGTVMSGYSNTIEGSLAEAESRARSAAEELARGAEMRSRAAIAEVERFRSEADSSTDRVLEDLRSKFNFVQKEVTSQLSSLTSHFAETSDEVRQRAAKAAAELEATQSHLRHQIDHLPGATKETTEAMRRALQDQLRALEQLSTLAAREGQRRDTAQPARPDPGHLLHARSAPQISPRSTPRQQLDQVTASLARELGARDTSHPPQPVSTRQPVAMGALPPSSTAQAQHTPTSLPAGGAPPAGGDGWSLGDLLARASREEDGGGESRRNAASPSSTSSQIDINGIARGIEPARAAEIWQRFREGQRGILGPHIYTREGVGAFEDVSRRYRADAAFRTTVNRYMTEFEALLRDCEQREPGGRTAQNHLVSEAGRVYLMLAHASGRLA
ncbi:MAG: hypothetical protein AB7E70_10965 [Hyphomicrobiaceae bacterium]